MPTTPTALTLIMAASLTRDVATGAVAAAVGLLAVWLGGRASSADRPDGTA